MALKIPPPPQFTGQEWQSFNRWLLEVTSVLSNTGGINPDEVTGLTAVIAQVGLNVTNITALQASSTGQAGQIATINGQITALTASIATINGQITTLNARAQVLNGITAPAGGTGNVNDYYVDTVAKHLYVKTAVGTWTLII